MNQSHIIDSWIAELGLSDRRLRRRQDLRPRERDAGLDRPADLAASRVSRTQTVSARPRLARVVASPC